MQSDRALRAREKLSGAHSLKRDRQNLKDCNPAKDGKKTLHPTNAIARPHQPTPNHNISDMAQTSTVLTDRGAGD